MNIFSPSLKTNTLSSQTAGISLEELGAKFGDEVALDFEHALEVKDANNFDDSKPKSLEVEAGVKEGTTRTPVL